MPLIGSTKLPTFSSVGVEISYVDEGQGPPVLLIHGFASNIAMNWIDPGWIDALIESGRRVIALDNRGHGHSEKLYELDDYGAPLMAEDARRLLQHLGISKADVIGYSMGARIGAFLALAHPEMVNAIIFGGLGYNMVRGMAGTGPIANALEAKSIEDVTNQTARSFRAFAERTGSDLKALAACIRSSRAPITREDVGKILHPALVAVGTQDVVGGSAQQLAELIPNAMAFEIENRDHMKAVGDQRFIREAIAFLAQHEAGLSS